MGTLSYPSTLPGPSLSEVTPVDRRLMSDLSGAAPQSRGIQRDYLGTQAVEWDILTPLEADLLNDWYSSVLVQGGAWFSSAWPTPQGWGLLVRRFLGELAWSHVGAGHWRVSGKTLVRGRGLPPLAPITYYTSHPYALIIEDSADVGMSMVSGLMWLPPQDFADVGFAIVSGTLAEILHVYNYWPTEPVDVGMGIVSGDLQVVLLVYNYWPTEPVDIGLTIVSGVLAEVLLTYSNWQAEPVDISFSIVSGTLT